MQVDTWKDKIQQASFRGVPFRVEQDQTEGGRRVEVLEYPARDIPYSPEHGAKAERYIISGFVISDSEQDYIQKRTALIEALNRSGGGDLVHPQFGLLSVQVEDWRIDHNKSRRGVSFFEMTFVDKGALLIPEVKSDTASQLLSVAKAVEEQTAEQLDDSLAVDDQPQFVIDSLTEQINENYSAISHLNGRIDSAVAPVAELSKAIDGVTTQAGTLIRTPVKFANATNSVFQSLYAIPGNIQQAFSSYQQINGVFESITHFGKATQSQTDQTNNAVGMSAFMRAANLSVYAQAVANASSDQFTDSAGALEIRNELLSEIDSISDVDDPDYYESLRALRLRVAEHMNEVAIQLPVVKTAALRSTVPLEVFSYLAHGAENSEAKIDELITRNAIPLTASIAAGVALEYTTDE